MSHCVQYIYLIVKMLLFNLQTETVGVYVMSKYALFKKNQTKIITQECRIEVKLIVYKNTW